MSDAILSVRGLSVHFPTRHKPDEPAVRAVDGVSFDLSAGETLGIVGESGCGKSTLGRAVLRLIEATGGEIRWAGEDALAFGSARLRRERWRMQIIFQDSFAALDPSLPVGKSVILPLRTFQPGLNRREIKAKLAATLDMVGLPQTLADRYPHELSGGQCQRVGIARALICGPEVIVCDEPVAALDVSIQAQIVNLLMRLQRERSLSLLFISHNLAVVRHISHRVMVLYLGKVLEMATREQLYARPLHPYSQFLMAAPPIADPRLERNRARALLTGDPPSPLDPPSGCVFRTRCPYREERCTQETPVLRDRGGGHLAACHRLDG